MKTYTKRLFISLAALILLSITFFGGVYAGFSNQPDVAKIIALTHKEVFASSTPADFSPFWKAWNILNQKYIDPGKIDDQKKVWGAIAGLAASYGDPYTVFFPPEENKTFASEISGNFEGIGMEVGMRDGFITVVSPLKGSPAEKAGIKVGDKIIKVDEKIVTDLSIDDAVKLIRGPKGTVVALTLLREGSEKPMIVKVTRDVVNLPTIESELRKDGIFTIRLYNFSAISTGLFNDALTKFVQSKSNKLILDLRGNPGGYLNAAVDIASVFLPQGKVIVREDYGQKMPQNIYRSDAGPKLPNLGKLKMVILVDGGSASASEILAGALKEQGVAQLVGVNTFGKGSVQELINVTPETSLKITVAKWLTPEGKSISDGGLSPDVEVKVTKEDVDKKFDAQMAKAVEILTKK